MRHQLIKNQHHFHNKARGFSLLELIMVIGVSGLLMTMLAQFLAELSNYSQSVANGQTISTMEMMISRQIGHEDSCIKTLATGAKTQISASSFDSNGQYQLTNIILKRTPLSGVSSPPETFPLNSFFDNGRLQLTKIFLSTKGPADEATQLNPGSMVQLWIGLEFTHRTDKTNTEKTIRKIPILVNVTNSVPPVIQGCSAYDTADLLAWVCGDLGGVPASGGCDFAGHTSVIAAPICDAIAHGVIGLDGRCH